MDLEAFMDKIEKRLDRYKRKAKADERYEIIFVDDYVHITCNGQIVETYTNPY